MANIIVEQTYHVYLTDAEIQKINGTNSVIIRIEDLNIMLHYGGAPNDEETI